jgi:predicted transposase YbfD/YdcC
VVAEGVRDGKSVDEVRHFVSSLTAGPDAKAFAHAVRSHWGVEDGCHWTLDVTYREDESRTRARHLRENMAWPDRFSPSLLEQHPGRDGVAMERRGRGWGDDLMQALTRSTC